MALDNAKNFAKVTVSTGYDAAATSIVLSSGNGAKLPTPPFNLVWWNATDYPDPSDDPNVEVVTCTNIVTDTLSVTRAQESTSATTKNTVGKTYKMIAGLTAKVVNIDLPTKMWTDSTPATAAGSTADSPAASFLGTHFSLGASEAAGWTIREVTGTASSTTISVYSETAGNVITLTTSPGIPTNILPAGSVVTLTGLTARPDLNNLNVTLTGNNGAGSLSFVDPNSSGLHGSTGETGTVTQVNPPSRLQFVPTGITTGSYIDSGSGGSVTVYEPQICFGTPGSGVPVTLRLPGTGTADALFSMTNALTIFFGSSGGFSLNGTNQIFNFAGADGGGSNNGIWLCPQLGQIYLRSNVILSSVSPPALGANLDWGVLRVGGSATSLDSGQISAGSLHLSQIATPGLPTLSIGQGAGSTTWGYKIVGIDINGQPTVATAEVTIATGAATLDSTHTIVITAPSTRGPGVVSLDVYRTTVGTSPTTTGKIGSIAQWTTGQNPRTLTDNGLAGDNATPPAVNLTGGVKQGTGVVWLSGSGAPENVVTGPVGSLYTRTDGGAGTTLYVKESGTGNTGWQAK